MKFPLISAGEFFELLRPAAFLLSAVLSIWVLTSTRRSGFRLYAGILWALGTYFLPFVVLPIYLIFRYPKRGTGLPGEHRPVKAESQIAARADSAAAERDKVRWRSLVPAAYGLLLLGATGVYLYRDYNSVDAHLARATQAKLSSQPAKTIREYRAALALEDSPHTHKLLGMELAEANLWTEALNELRSAERGGEPDDSLPFRIGQVLSAKGDQGEAIPEYHMFLDSHACTQELADYRCEIARAGVAQKSR